MGVSAVMIDKLEDLDPKVRDAFVCYIHEVEGVQYKKVTQGNLPMTNPR